MVLTEFAYETGSSVSQAPLLSVRDLAKRYGRHDVLTGVDFEIATHSMVGIQGENGAGKSTLLKCLIGMIHADRGAVEVDGRIGFCPQEPTLIPLLTVGEFLRLMAAGYHLPRARAMERTGELLDLFGATKYADTRIDRLSGGTRQKVNLISALLHDPDLLLLDEPYQGLDYETYLTFWTYAEQFRDRGGSVVVVSHMHTEQYRFDRLLVLTGGAVEDAEVPPGRRVGER